MPDFPTLIAANLFARVRALALVQARCARQVCSNQQISMPVAEPPLEHAARMLAAAGTTEEVATAGKCNELGNCALGSSRGKV